MKLISGDPGIVQDFLSSGDPIGAYKWMTVVKEDVVVLNQLLSWLYGEIPTFRIYKRNGGYPFAPTGSASGFWCVVNPTTCRGCPLWKHNDGPCYPSQDDGDTTIKSRLLTPKMYLVLLERLTLLCTVHGEAIARLPGGKRALKRLGWDAKGMQK